MALVLGGVSPFGAIAGLIVQNTDSNRNWEEAQSLDDDGHISGGDLHSYNFRDEPSAEYELPVSASGSAASISVDIGGALTGHLITGATITQGNTAYPRLSVQGIKYDDGSYVPDAYSLVVDGLYFGCHTVGVGLTASLDAAITGHTPGNLQSVSIAASLANQPAASDADGNNLQTQGTVVRVEVSGVLIDDGSAVSVGSGWIGGSWPTTANNDYKRLAFRCVKFFDCATGGSVTPF